MNKTYKVLFNRIRGVATAVSEIASSHQARKKATTVVVAVAMGMMAGQAMAGSSVQPNPDLYGVDIAPTAQVSTDQVESSAQDKHVESVAYVWESQGGYYKSGTPQQPTTTTGADFTVKAGDWSGIFGGFSDDDVVKNNTVRVEGGSMSNVCAGYSNKNNAEGNALSVSGGTVINLYGGYTTDDGYASHNTVTVEGDVTVSTLYGGYSNASATGKNPQYSGNVEKNVVSISAGTIKYVVGGFSASNSDSTDTISGSARNNVVEVKGAAIVSDGIWGGYSSSSVFNFQNSTSGNAAGNAVMLSGTATINNKVYGGYSTLSVNGSVDNTSGGDAGGNHYFDISKAAQDQTEGAGNYVSVAGSATVKNSIHGGHATGGSANYNTVSISNAATIGASGNIEIVGGFTLSTDKTKSASNNIVTISGGTFSENADIPIYGGLAFIQGGSNESTANASANRVEISAMAQGFVDSVFGGKSQAGSAGGSRLYKFNGTAQEHEEAGNYVSISGGTVKAKNNPSSLSYICGGYVDSQAGGSANYNMVSISGDAVIDASDNGNMYIVGGYTASTEEENIQTASNNQVTINGGEFKQILDSSYIFVYGGLAGEYSLDELSCATVSGNSVVISKINGGVTGVYGGSSIRGSASGSAYYGDTSVDQTKWGNYVSISDGTVNIIAGGYVWNGASLVAANYNSVFVSGEATIPEWGSIYGGYAYSESGCEANNNRVIINGGKFLGSVASVAGGSVGSSSAESHANGNVVEILQMEGTIGTVVGGETISTNNNSAAKCNIVKVRGGTITNVYGGHARAFSLTSGSADSNTVLLRGGTIKGAVYGGASDVSGVASGSASTNAVIWESGTIDEGVYGGFASQGCSTDNTLSIIGAKPYLLNEDDPPSSLGYSVKKVEGVQNYLFVINDTSIIQNVSSINSVTTAEEDVMLKIATAPTLDNAKYHVAVAFADGLDTSQVKVGSKTVLMNAAPGATFTSDLTADGVVLDLEEGGNTYASSTISKAISKVNEYAFDVKQNTAGYLVAELMDIAPNDLTLSTRDIAYANLVNFRSQMSNVTERMGELRTTRNAGGWARIYGGTYSFGEGRKDKSFTLQVGADRWFDANSYFGLMGSYTKAEDTLTNGENDQKNWNVGFYTGYVADSGLFWDATVRHGKFENKYNISSLIPVSGKYHTYGTSASIEGGWRFDCPSTNFYVEPQGELMYGHMQSVTYNAGDVTIKNDAVNTFVGRVGVAAGYMFAEDQGNLYLRTSLLHDFKGKVKTQAVSGNETDGGFTKDFGGTWGEFVLGGNYKASKNVNLYGEMTCSTKNAGVRTKWQGSIGARWTF